MNPKKEVLWSLWVHPTAKPAKLKSIWKLTAQDSNMRIMPQGRKAGCDQAAARIQSSFASLLAHCNRQRTHVYTVNSA